MNTYREPVMEYSPKLNQIHKWFPFLLFMPYIILQYPLCVQDLKIKDGRNMPLVSHSWADHLCMCIEDQVGAVCWLQHHVCVEGPALSSQQMGHKPDTLC